MIVRVLGRIAVVAAAFMLLPGGALAETRCDPAGTQRQMNLCAADELAEADAALNAAWQRLLAALHGEPMAIEATRKAQRQWLAFRDAEVAAHFPVVQGDDARVMYGSMYPLLRDGLLAGLTRERTEHLEARLEQLTAP